MDAPGDTAPPSRFVSQNDLSEAQKRREEEIRAAYARIGQEPPPEPTKEELSDTRSLYERLEEAKALKQDRWEEMFRVARRKGLNESEAAFLDEVEQKRKDKEDSKRRDENFELDKFRQ